MNYHHSPGRTWSPGLAHLKRGRNRQINDTNLLKITAASLDDEKDIFPLFSSSSSRKKKTSPPKKSKSVIETRSTKNNTKKKKANRRSLSPTLKRQSLTAKSHTRRSLASVDRFRKERTNVPPEIQTKLDIIFNENTPVKERLELEVRMGRDPVERNYLVVARYDRDRMTMIDLVEDLNDQQEEEMAEHIRKEEDRAKEEQDEFEAKRQARIKEGKESKARLQKAAEEARKHAAVQRAKDAEELRRAVEKTKRGQAQNIEKKQKGRDAHEAQKKRLLADEENDVLRKLRAAMIDQVPVRNQV